MSNIGKKIYKYAILDFLCYDCACGCAYLYACMCLCLLGMSLFLVGYGTTDTKLSGNTILIE